MAIQIRRGTESQWNANKSNIVAGEPAVVTDTERAFIGTGNGTYMELANKARVDEIDASVEDADKLQKLLNDEIPNTVQNYTFTDGSVSKVEHTNGSDIIRTDTFTYATNTITETRTLNSGEVLTIVTNLTTLQTTVTYTN